MHHPPVSSHFTPRSRSVPRILAAMLGGALIAGLSPLSADADLGQSVGDASLVVQTTPARSSFDSPPAQSERGGQQVISLPNIEATWTSRRRPAQVMRSSKVLKVRQGSRQAFLKFDGTDLDTMEVTDAYLRLWAVRGTARRGSLVVKKTVRSWTSGNLTHNDRPPSAQTRLNARPRASARGRWVNIRLVRDLEELTGSAVSLRVTSRKRSERGVFVRQGKKAPQLVVVGTTLTPTPATPPPTPTPTPTPTSTDDHGRVFAHYFPPYPISIDNKPADRDYYTVNYLDPEGEGGKHSAYGGLLRDRPTPRDPRPGDWRLADMRTEVRQATSAGIDGFTVDILSFSGRTWDASVRLMEAADLEGDFEIIPMIDSASMRTTPAAETATALAQLFAHPSAQQIDGDYVFSSFCAECRTVSWWSDVIELLETTHGLPVKFIANFIGVTNDRLSAFAPISYGAGMWGTRNAAAVLAGSNIAVRAHNLGMTWMQPIAVQDARPRSGAYAEAGNTETLRATWSRAISDGADFVQIATWNDYSESTTIAPSHAHGNVFLELTSYYAEWFRTGKEPVVVEDHLYLTHRIHPVDAQPKLSTPPMKSTLGGSKVAPRDTAEALVLLAAPASVTVTSGSESRTVDLPAGVSSVLVPLGLGQTSGSIRRGAPVLTVTSPHHVTDTPTVQDFQYYAAGS